MPQAVCLQLAVDLLLPNLQISSPTRPDKNDGQGTSRCILQHAAGWNQAQSRGHSPNSYIIGGYAFPLDPRPRRTGARHHAVRYGGPGTKIANNVFPPVRDGWYDDGVPIQETHHAADIECNVRVLGSVAGFPYAHQGIGRSASRRHWGPQRSISRWGPHYQRTCRLRHRRRSFLSQAGRGAGHGVQGWRPGQARPADLPRARLQLDSPAAVPHAHAPAEQPGLHHCLGQGRQETRFQVPAGLSLLRHLGRSRQADHPQGLGGQVPRRARAGGARVYPRHDYRLSRGGRSAGHGPARQRDHARHALARRQAARQLGQFRGTAQGRHRRREGRQRRLHRRPGS